MKLQQICDEQDKACASSIGNSAIVPAGIHGGLDFEELRRMGLNPDAVLDFSANVNPYGPSQKVWEAIAGVAVDRYPDRESLALRQALSETHGAPITQILPGNGVSELIWLTVLAFAKPGERVLVVGPTYCEYARAALLRSALVTTYHAQDEASFVPNANAIKGRIAATKPRIAYICNPNNPTGVVLDPSVIGQWVQEFPHTLFVVDEAYLPFAKGLGSVLKHARGNLLVLRSMTKDCSLAGLRLGFAFGQPEVIATLRQMQPPWSVNAIAQAAGIAVLSDSERVHQTLSMVANAKQELVHRLTLLGMSCLPSATHFFLMRAPHDDGSALRQALLNRGILIRDCASFGLPAFVRIATRRPDENEQLLSAIREVL